VRLVTGRESGEREESRGPPDGIQFVGQTMCPGARVRPTDGATIAGLVVRARRAAVMLD